MLDEDEIKEFPCQLKFPNALILKYQDVSDLSGKAEHLRLARKTDGDLAALIKKKKTQTKH